jgi:hypothetical protein
VKVELVRVSVDGVDLTPYVTSLDLRPATIDLSGDRSCGCSSFADDTGEWWIALCVEHETDIANGA